MTVDFSIIVSINIEGNYNNIGNENSYKLRNTSGTVPDIDVWHLRCVNHKLTVSMENSHKHK